MSPFAQSFADAAALLFALDSTLLSIVGLSLGVTLSAVAIGCLIGMPLGALLAVGRFPGRNALTLIVNAAMGLPPVVVGLTLYLLLSQAGPLAPLDLLYTPAAMIAAQVVLVTPIIAALTRSGVAEAHAEFDETLRALRARGLRRTLTLMREAQTALVTAALAGMGRAMAEVGAVMIVGGNIAGVTRVMTTAIALETSRGELALALALGLILLILSLAPNALVMSLRPMAAQRGHYA